MRTLLLIPALLVGLLVGLLTPATPAAAAEPALISQGRPATSSGIHPERANDADASNAGGYFDTELLGGRNGWWQVDLQGTYRISQINNRNYVDGTRFYHYYVRTSLDGVNWGAPVARKYTNAPASDVGEGYLVDAVARYVRVNIVKNSANASGHLTDFKVYGQPLAQATNAPVHFEDVATTAPSYPQGAAPTLSWRVKADGPGNVDIASIHAIVGGLDQPSYRWNSVAQVTDTVLAPGQELSRTHNLAVPAAAGAYGVFLRVTLSDGRIWEGFHTFFRVTTANQLTSYRIATDTHQGFPVYRLDGGMSAEYAVQKSAEALTATAGPSWEVSGPGSGPRPVLATRDFLARSVGTTVDFLDGAIGAQSKVDTVIIGTGVASAPYLARTMKATVLPVHFLVSFDSVQELRAILDHANAQGMDAYTTLGHDGSVAKGVAWIKLRSLPDAYRDFLVRHQTKRVVYLGSDGTQGGENTARQVQGEEMIAMLPGGGSANDYHQLNAKIADFSDLPLAPGTIQVSDWESGVVTEQLDGFGQDIREGVPNVQEQVFVTGSSYDKLYDLASWATASFYKKNGITPTGIVLNPYLMSHPFAESSRGLIPHLYWQGTPATDTVDRRLLGSTASALQKYFPGIGITTLPAHVAASRNFGAAHVTTALPPRLTANGFASPTLGDVTVDEVWNPADGINAPGEKALTNLAAGGTPAHWRGWDAARTPLTVADLQAISSAYPDVSVRQLQ